MAKSNAEDPLLAVIVDSSSNQSTLNNTLEKKETRNDNNVPEFIDHPELIFSNSLDFKKVIIFLTAYLIIGAFCFFIVMHQIKGSKTNRIFDAVYFCVVTMTTVGYGDLVPESVMSKLLACIFVFSGMALVGFFLSRAADYIVEKQEHLLVKAIHMREKYSNVEILKEVESHKVKYRFVVSSVLLLVLVVVGTFFLYCNEGLDLFDAFYCVCATITTLGYGDESFSTFEGRVFASFWILTSTICLAQFYYSLAELYTEKRRRLLVDWVLNRRLTVSDLEKADLDNDNIVSAAEFIVFKLKELGKISEEDIAMVMEGFNSLDVDHSGTLTKDDIVNAESSSS